VSDVRAIVAIGRRGQLGLAGRMPWEGAKGEAYVADVQRFFDVTRGHVLVAGPRTIASVPRFAYADRTIEVIRSATVNAAKVVKQEGKLGVVEAGAHADLIVVDGDPLKNLALLTGQGRHMPAIMRAGRFVKDELAA